MARILFGCLPAYGVINPSFPLVKALVAAGHDVDYFVPESFRTAVEKIGATPIPWGFYLDGPIVRPQQIARFGRRMFGDQDAGLRTLGPRYDAVVAAGMQPTLPELQDSLDVPVVFCSPVFFQSPRVMAHLADIGDGLPGVARRLMRSDGQRSALGAMFGLAMLGRPLGDIVAMMAPRSRTLNITPASWLYQPCADEFSDPTCVFMGPTPTLASSQAVLDSFPLDRVREHDGPVVYGTLGTVFNTWTPFFRTLADAFAGTDVLLVLTTGNEANRAAVGPVADNVIVSSFVPQAEVLERADVCFTHGGFGSATDAVALGATPIVTPMGADQFFNAYRLEELNAGRVLPKREFTVGAVRDVYQAVRHDDRLAAGLGALRESFAEAEGPAGAARRIGDLIAAS
ncbi:nucleotide disphospho-sugar-binding domain-containing protein [Propioniciclava soli]|uniref:nucleotide disphospho-sugar-binding domain-containing protein n=1 Tax=Propioniciclava soli TaxID=2775081 RepID=UPI001E352E8D|nr:nucleotide disphospho-sugar-binding domain-containing protein [Propioniciclava soli]